MIGGQLALISCGHNQQLGNNYSSMGSGVASWDTRHMRACTVIILIRIIKIDTADMLLKNVFQNDDGSCPSCPVRQLHESASAVI